ncbi:hypothetical protein F511_37390 [Dorcoceras hygrometricum]|uniref:Uncharacterized protein n=1 Tax=Dorcoceras hygrometricum TaxID=472368 RepID=A0A2Z7AAU7_9LAMI|nr:hypothetical protein F511_37390 [Dorcoceras hygrometricum]
MQHAIINAMKCMRAIKDRIATPVYQLAIISVSLYTRTVYQSGKSSVRDLQSSSAHHSSMISPGTANLKPSLTGHENSAISPGTANLKPSLTGHDNSTISPGTTNLKPSLTGHDNSTSKGSDDENVENVETPVTLEVTGETVVEQESAVENVIESVDVQRVETAVDISEDETVSVFEKFEPTMANVPVAEYATEETAQMGADEEEIDIGGPTVSGSAVGSQAVEKADDFELLLNLSYEEFHARQAGQPVVTASDTDEDIETIDVGTGVGNPQLQTFDTADRRTDASADYIVTDPVEEMEMAAVEQHADEAMSMEEILMTIPETCLEIPATDKGKALLQERDPVKGNPVMEQFLLIVADIDLLVQLREQIIDKENVLTKYRELLIRKCLEAHRENFVPGDGSSAIDLKILAKLSSLHLFLVEELKMEVQAHGLKWDKTCCSQIFEGRPRDRAEEDQHVQRLLDQRPFSSSSSDDSSLNFYDTDAAVTSLFLPTAATDVPDAFAQLRASIDQLHFEQIRRKDDFDKLRDTLLINIRDIDKKFSERFDAHDRTYRVLLNNIRHDAPDHKNLLSLDLKSSQKKLSTQVAAAAFDTVDVRKEVKELNAKVTYLDGQVAAIRRELFDFRSKAEENHLNLSTKLGFLVDYINRGGDAKKGEGGSSRPQPPPDNQSRPSGGNGGTGSRAGDQSRSRGNISREDRSRGGECGCERRRPDDRSGHSKRRRSDSGESGMDSGLPPKKGYQWLLFGE